MSELPLVFSTIPEIINEFAAGRLVIVADDPARENEADLAGAASLCTPEMVNFMAVHARGLICAPLTAERAEELDLPQMTRRNREGHKTAFTVSVDAATGISTGISAADRALTIRLLADPAVNAEAFVQPGHVFPLQAVPDGVLRRTGHTEAALDLAGLAGLPRAAVICEIMNDDGTMARLPDLLAFAAAHGLRIGTIAALIEHRSRHESLIEKIGSRVLTTAFGEFTAHAFKDKPGQGLHLALSKGQWEATEAVAARVHEPLSVLDVLEVGRGMHSWNLDESLQYIANAGKGVVVLLNCGESAAQLLAQFEGTARASQAPERGRMDLRTYGIGAQILRACGVQKMNLLGNPRRMPSMMGYGLETISYVTK